MITGGADLLRLADAFQRAAIDGASWLAALKGLAEATGSRCGQLIGIGANAVEHFNMITDFDLDVLQHFPAAGGTDPVRNPRVAAAMTAAPFEVLAESDFIAPEDYARHPHYQEFARPCEIPFCCLSPVHREGDVFIGLAVQRTEQQGPIADSQRATFAAAAPLVRGAVRSQLALEGQGSSLIHGLLDALSVPAFICDRRGLVQAVTPSAERLVGDGGPLQLKAGRLRPPRQQDAAALEHALLAAADASHPDRPVFQSVVVGTADNTTPLVLEVIALPARPFELSFTPRVVVVAGGRRNGARRKAAILRAAYSLTPAETDIALRLSAGVAPEDIAAHRGVAVGTVRAQIKPLLAKVGVKRQAELVARLGRLQL